MKTSFASFIARFIVLATSVSAGVILVGLAWFLCAHPGASPGDHIFTGEPNYFRNLSAMIARAVSLDEVGHRRGLIMIGVVLLLAGPPLRVALAAAASALEKDWFYAANGLLVLLILAVGFLW